MQKWYPDSGSTARGQLTTRCTATRASLPVEFVDFFTVHPFRSPRTHSQRVWVSLGRSADIPDTAFGQDCRSFVCSKWYVRIRVCGRACPRQAGSIYLSSRCARLLCGADGTGGRHTAEPRAAVNPSLQPLSEAFALIFQVTGKTSAGVAGSTTHNPGCVPGREMAAQSSLCPARERTPAPVSSAARCRMTSGTRA